VGSELGFRWERKPRAAAAVRSNPNGAMRRVRGERGLGFREGGVEVVDESERKRTSRWGRRAVGLGALSFFRRLFVFSARFDGLAPGACGCRAVRIL
jgi:hypothetical protein